MVIVLLGIFAFVVALALIIVYSKSTWTALIEVAVLMGVALYGVSLATSG